MQVICDKNYARCDKMRKISCAAGLRICLLLCACSQQKPIRLLADAEIVSTDSRNQTITVRDAGETTVFGEHGTAACSKAALSAYNSDSGKTQEIGFEDLRVGDYVVIGLYEDEKAQAQTETVHAESVERMRQKSAQD